MSRSVLSISWVNGRVKAVHVRGSKTVAQWAHPSAVEEVGELATLIAEAAAQVRFNGRDVSFVIDNRHVLYRLPEAADCRKGLIPSFIQRRVDQSRFSEDEPASYGISQPIQVKSGQRFLLTLLPRGWVIQLRDACSAK